MSSLRDNKNLQICTVFALLNDKILAASGGMASPPDSMTKSSVPVPRWGLRPPDLRYIGSRFTLAMSPTPTFMKKFTPSLCPNLNESG